MMVPNKTAAKPFDSAAIPPTPKKAAEAVASMLRHRGFQAYFVGGSVRDLLRGVEPKDYDVATDARPEEVAELFPGSLLVGAQFGVVGVMIGEHRVEVATFRNDGLYSDGRRPDAVSYTRDPREDVLRRDFTVNGLLLDPASGEVLDFVEGRKDLERRVIRAIGEPERRFTEDRLRMLRAVRFAAALEFEIDGETFRAIQRLSGEIASVSAERVRDELLRILTSGRARRGFELLDSSGLLARLLPEISAMKGVEQPPEFHPEGDVWTHTLLMLEALPQDCPATLAAGVLLHDVGKPPTFRVAPDRIRFDNHVSVGMRMAEAICKRLRFSHDQTAQIVALVEHHLRFKDVPQMRASTLKRFLRLEKFEEHLELHRLDCLSSHRNLENYEFVRSRLRELPQEQIRPQRLITGDDLIALGLQPGPRFQEILRAVEDAQLEGQIASREDALRLVQKHFKTVYILGVDHRLQVAELMTAALTTEKKQKDKFRELLRSLVADNSIQFVGEEMDIQTHWGEYRAAWQNLAKIYSGESVSLPEHAETIAFQVARDADCPYAEIDIPSAQRDAMGIRRNYHHNSTEGEMGEWDREREKYMFERTIEHSGGLQNVLVVCGYDHADNLARLFQQAGHSVHVQDVRKEDWYLENWE